MKRRHFIHLGLVGMVGCDQEHSVTKARTAVGPFALTIPQKWQKSAVIEKMPIFPLYSREEWKILQRDERSESKPGYICRPQHWAVRLPSALPEGISITKGDVGDDPTAPQILIHKADEWDVAFTDGEYQDRNIYEMLRSMRERMDAALTQDVPYLSPGYFDGTLSFMCLKRRLDFAGGHGIRLVAQWTIEAELLRLGDLHYLFLGMSDDNSVQIIATFPLNLPGLPGSEDESHLGWSTKNYPEFTRSHDDYEKDAKKWLEQGADQITPSLRELDGMIQSLVASHWK